MVKVDRSGLNEHHPAVARLYAAIDRVLAPIVAAEERRAGAHLIGAPRAVTARDQVGLRALNDLLKTAFDQPGTAAAEPGDHPASKPPTQPAEQIDEPDEEPVEPQQPGEQVPTPPPEPAPARALWFKQSPVRLYPGEKRTVTMLANPQLIRRAARWRSRPTLA